VTRDYIRYARLVDQLDAIDYQSTAFIPGDVSEQVADSYRLYLSLVYGVGPVVTGAFGLEGLRVMVDLLAAVRGGEAALAGAPLAVFSCCPTAPLRWSQEAATGTVECARRRIPVEIIPMPLTGFVAPGTLLGTLVQHTAEVLSGIVISQTAAPGAPVVWGGSPAVFDYRHESTPMGAVETQMIECACAEIGRSQGLPTQAYIGLSDSKRLDAQAGLESASGAVLAGLAGINSVSGSGMLDFENSFSLEKLVLDDEICAMVKRLLGGIEVREGDFPSTPHFEELIREGHLLISDHTRRWFREEVRFPGAVIDRTKEPDAGEGGAGSLEERARHRVEQLLEKESRPLDPDRRKDLDGIMSRAAAAAGMERLPAHDL
jgi:trimethylamine--corrinoid protein Co-methyltransferase